jgi:CBS domain containing-hemolysin-like protein
MSVFLILLIIILLIAINALYVAAEFSSVSTRRSRMSRWAAEGNPRAEAVLNVIENPALLDRYIATCQLGITISSLMLGFFAQGQVAELVSPYLVRFGNLSEVAARSIGATLMLLIFTILQALLGELVPKNIGLQYPGRLAMATYLPLRWSMIIFRPLIWFFNGSGLLLMRLFGLTVEAEHTHVHAPEEILMLVEESEAGGLLDEEERLLLVNTLRLGSLPVRQVMIPRTKILAAAVNETSDKLLARVAESSFSRLLLYEETIDNVVGVIHLKDLLCLDYHTQQTDVRAAMRPVQFVHESMPVEQVLTLLQRDQYYVAVVVDEFGGTAGLVTLKDLVEEIFGEFVDEFDEHVPMIRLVDDKRLLVRGDVLINELNDWLNLFLPTEDVDTIGGLILCETGYVPEIGQEVQINGIGFRVDALDRRRVSVVSLAVTPKQIERMKAVLDG